MTVSQYSKVQYSTVQKNALLVVNEGFWTHCSGSQKRTALVAWGGCAAQTQWCVQHCTGSIWQSVAPVFGWFVWRQGPWSCEGQFSTVPVCVVHQLYSGVQGLLCVAASCVLLCADDGLLQQPWWHCRVLQCMCRSALVAGVCNMGGAVRTMDSVRNVGTVDYGGCLSGWAMAWLPVCVDDTGGVECVIAVGSVDVVATLVTAGRCCGCGPVWTAGVDCGSVLQVCMPAHAVCGMHKSVTRQHTAVHTRAHTQHWPADTM